MITPTLNPIPLTLWMVVFLMILISQAITLFAAYFKLDQIEDHFIASHLVSITRNTAGNGPLGRMNRIRLISSLTGSFNLYQMLDPYAFMEAEILPTSLKKWATIPNNIMRVALIGVGLLVLWCGFVSLLIEISSPASNLKLLCFSILLGCLSIMFMFLFFWVYISFSKLGELESHLNESYFVGRNRRVMGNGFYGRYCRLSHISTMFFLDDASLCSSDPHAMDEIKRFPLRLRRLVTIPYQFFCYSFLGFCVFWLCGKLFGLLG
ncbi:hypothetical protein ACYZT8_10930 [Pseudomonas sp. LB3P93]